MLPNPIPKHGITIRPGVRADLPFIDRLQKADRHGLGFMFAGTLEGKIDLGHVLVAEGGRTKDEGGGMKDEGGRAEGKIGAASASSFILPPSSLRPLGYVIGSDRYYKRDDVGVIYQVAVEKSARRGLVAAALLAAMFDRWAYGCRLACCWCAQDLTAANQFWEAVGFSPIAFRGGSRAKKRVHIFWQRRVRAGDEATPWWYPAVTQGGAMGADRVAMPIPPGTHWSDVRRPVMPGDDEMKALPSPRAKKRVAAPKMVFPPPHLISSGGLRFAPVAAEVPAVVEKVEKAREPRVSKRLLDFSREMRDRWQERVSEEPWIVAGRGKYDVARVLETQERRGEIEAAVRPALPEAA